MPFFARIAMVLLGAAAAQSGLAAVRAMLELVADRGASVKNLDWRDR